MKATQQEVQVVAEEGHPQTLTWSGRSYRVAVLDRWRYGGRWWLAEPPRDCFLVQFGPLTAELHREDAPGGRWVLARMVD